MSLPTPSRQQQALINGLLSGQNVISNSVAGSGKSTTGLNLIDAYLSQYPTQKALLVAFQKNVQEEFQAKAKKNFPQEKLDMLTVRTSYSLGLQLLKEHHPELKAPMVYKGNLLVAKLLGGVYARMGGRDSLRAQTLYGVWEDTKRRCIGLYQISQARLLTRTDEIRALEAERAIFSVPPPEEVFEVIVKAIEYAWNELTHEDKYDFIDMVSAPARQGYTSPITFNLIVADEAQDLSPAQLAVVQAYANPDTQFAFLGDRSQAIMQFCGAMNSTMDTLQSTFAATEYRIPVSYRIPLAVRDTARQFVPDLEAREDAPQGWVGNISLTKAVDRMQAGDLVIARTISQLLEVAVVILANGKPVNFRGQDIKARIQDALDVIERRWGLDNFPYGLQEYIHESIQFLKDKHGHDGTEAEVDELNRLGTSLLSLYQYAISKQQYNFAAFVKGLFEESGSKKRVPKINLMSIHQSKGLEADNVFAIVPQGGYPYRTMAMSPSQMQEENNVAYVAFTRAKSALWLVLPDTTETPSEIAPQTQPEVLVEMSEEEKFIASIAWDNMAKLKVDYVDMIRKYRMLDSGSKQKALDELHLSMRDVCMEQEGVEKWFGVVSALGLLKQRELI